MQKFTSLTDLANGLNKCTDSSNFKAWEKGSKKRIYFNHIGHNSKKMSTKVWLELTDKVTAICIIDCPSQPMSWIESQKKEVLDYAERYVRYARRFFALNMATQPLEVIMHNALLDVEEVQGYTLQWRNVRIAINRFGKLADRNRQFVVPFRGTKDSAPRGFVPLTAAGFALLIKRGGTEQGEMLEPYASPLDYDAMALRMAENN